MSLLDRFQSQFAAAAKDPFHLVEHPLRRIALVTDLDEVGHTSLRASLDERFTSFWDDTTEWTDLVVSDMSVAHLTEALESLSPDLIITYRNLTVAESSAYSLGAYLDTMTQMLPCPVLVLPAPGSPADDSECRNVMVLTDHLAGADHLVSWGVQVAPPGGVLVLAHVEDDTVFQRYMDVISKVPDLDTDLARERIGSQLLKEPTDYVESCRSVVQSVDNTSHDVHAEVCMGHQVADVLRLVSEHEVDVLVLNTKDDGQLAMHGLAYPIAVELRSVALLML